MRLRRSTKLIVPLLVACVSLWIQSWWVSVSISLPLTSSQTVGIGSAVGRAYFTMSPYRGPFTASDVVSIELFPVEHYPGDSVFGDAAYMRHPRGGWLLIIAPRWWLICWLLVLLWVLLWYRDRRRVARTQMPGSESAAG